MKDSQLRASWALAATCPAPDVAATASIVSRHGLALLPAGGPGDLDRALEVTTLLLVELTEEGPKPAINWRAELAMHVPLSGPTPEELLPKTWLARHPQAYSRARQSSHLEQHGPTEAELWDDEDEPAPLQVFIPIERLVALTLEEQVFTNELVPKQQRRGRRFAPSVPTLVRLPD